MSLFHDHFLLLTWLAGLLSAFLALLWREDPRARTRFFVRAFLGLTCGSVAVAWLLSAVPR